jgi:hypothetical protein
MTIGSFARRYCLLVYWLMFTLITLQRAQYPGLLIHPEQWRYPWRAVVEMSAFLAVMVGLLHLILRPVTFHHSWGRLFGALLYATVLLLGLGATPKGTDMPGYHHVPALFSVVTMVGMLTLALIEVVGAWVRRRRHAA